MADSIREKILQNIQTTLQLINGTGGYVNTVSLVERTRANAANHEGFPTIYIYDGKAHYEIEPYDHTTKKLEVILEVWTRTQGLNPSVVINSLLADIEKALMVDAKRGTNAIDTYYTGDDVYIGDPLADECGAIVNLEVTFRTKRTDPTALM